MSSFKEIVYEYKDLDKEQTDQRLNDYWDNATCPFCKKKFLSNVKLYTHSIECISELQKEKEKLQHHFNPSRR